MAYESIPILERLIKGNNTQLKKMATEALKKIDPEYASQMGIL